LGAFQRNNELGFCEAQRERERECVCVCVWCWSFVDAIMNLFSVFQTLKLGVCGRRGLPVEGDKNPVHNFIFLNPECTRTDANNSEFEPMTIPCEQVIIFLLSPPPMWVQAYNY
jgi:hypothetical protein